MKQAKKGLQDLLKALGIGFLISIVVGVVLFFFGFFLDHLTVLSGLEVAKNGLLLVVTIDLFLLAGMLMIKGKKPEQSSESTGWKKHFYLIGYKTVMGIICIAVLMVASGIDYLKFFLS